jgi:hypothetical protein
VDVQALSDLGAKLTGYPAISIFHDFKYHPKEIITGTQDWVYEHLGALFWTVEIWAPNKEAGITDYKWIEWYRDHPVEDDLKLLKWSDEQCGGQAHVDWYPFRHPQLGMVELGGWDKHELLAQPAAAPARTRGGALPGLADADRAVAAALEVLRTEVRALGPDTWRVRFAVANSGYLPAYVSKRALERKTVRGTMFQIHLPPGVAWSAARNASKARTWTAMRPRPALQAFLPNREVTADRAVVEWVVHGAARHAHRADRPRRPRRHGAHRGHAGLRTAAPTSLAPLSPGSTTSASANAAAGSPWCRHRPRWKTMPTPPTTRRACSSAPRRVFISSGTAAG